MEHENDPDIDEPFVPPARNTLGTTEEQSQSPTETSECMFFWSSSLSISWKHCHCFVTQHKMLLSLSFLSVTKTKNSH